MSVWPPVPMPDGDLDRGDRVAPMRLSAGPVPEAAAAGRTTGRRVAGGAGG